MNDVAAGEAVAGPGPAKAAGGFFREDLVAKEGKFAEGWSGRFEEMGLGRLAAKGAQSKDEASFWKMLDDTIGHASKKMVSRPGEGAAPQELAEYRKLVDAPEAAEAYGFKPEKLPEGWAWDDAVAEEVHGILHKHHAPKGLGRELSDFYVKTMEGQAREAREVVEGRIAGLAEESRARFAKEWGEDAETRRAANAEFVKARKFDTRDPIVRAALSHPEMVRIIDEARRAAKEVPLAGVDKEVFSGSASPREQAQEIMRGDRNWTNDPVKVRKVGELYGGGKKRR